MHRHLPPSIKYNNYQDLTSEGREASGIWPIGLQSNRLSSTVSGSLSQGTFGSVGTLTRTPRLTMGSSMPDGLLDSLLHSEKVTVWVDMRREGGLIGLFFFAVEHGLTQKNNTHIEHLF